jgi:hypothetical protein
VDTKSPQKYLTNNRSQSPALLKPVPGVAASMPIRLRKLIGAVLLLVAVIYYVAVGLGWVLPAMPLVRWMSRPDATPR